MSHWRAYRDRYMWEIGWVGPEMWFSVAHLQTITVLDIGHWRIRWVGVGFRPLFSERYGHQKWHKIGRLGFHNARHDRRMRP